MPKSLFDWKFQIATPTIKSTEYKKFQSRDIVSKKSNVCSLKRLYKKEVTCKRVWQKSPNKYELLFFIIDDDFIQFADCFNYCYLTKMENCLLYICSKGTFTRFVHTVGPIFFFLREINWVGPLLDVRCRFYTFDTNISAKWYSIRKYLSLWIL